MQTFYKCLLLQILLLKISPSVQDIDWDLFPPEDAVTSKSYLFVGEYLNITCTLSDELLKNWTADDIFFKFSQPLKANSRVTCVESSKVQVVDSSTAMLSIPDVSLSEVGLFDCCVAHRGCGDPKFLFVGSTEDIYIQYQPENVTDFKCVIYNWDDHMNCTWTNPVPYADYDPRDTFFLIKEGELSNVTLCPQNDSVSCVWPKDHFQLKDTYTITVEVWNTVNKIHTSQVFTLNADEIVKPAPVKNLSVKVLSDLCLELSWTQESHGPKNYRISQQKKVDPEFKVITDNETSNSYKICDYVPFLNYSFSVDCHPLGLKGYWSDPEIIKNFRTPEKAPMSGPVTTNGSYNTSECMYGLRNVTLYWQDVEESSRNGIIINYSVMHSGQVLTRVPAGMFQATVVVKCTESPLMLNILAHNLAGESVQPSVLSLAPANFSVTSKVKDTFYISWYKNGSFQSWWQSDDQIMNYTLFWLSPFNKEPIAWQKVSGPGVLVPLSQDLTKTYFGIAATDRTSGWTSGIFWSNKSFRADPDDIKCDPYTLNVKGGIQSALIMWGKVACPYIRVTGFVLKYCLIDECSTSMKALNLSASLNMYTLQSLVANEKYKVIFQIESEDKLGPEVQTEVVTLAPEANTATIVVIVVVIVITLLIIACGVFMWKCRQSKLRNKKYQLDDAFCTHQDKISSVLPHHPAGLFSKLVSFPDVIDFNGSLSTSSSSDQSQLAITADLMGDNRSSTEQSVRQEPCIPVMNRSSFVDVNDGEAMKYFRSEELVPLPDDLTNPSFNGGNKLKYQDSMNTNPDSLPSYLLVATSQSVGSTTTQLTPSQSVGSTTTQLAPSQSVGSTTTQLTPSQSVGSTTTPLAPSQSVGSTTTQLAPSQSVGSTTTQLTPSQSVGSTTTQLAPSQSVGSTTTQLTPSQSGGSTTLHSYIPHTVSMTRQAVPDYIPFS